MSMTTREPWQPVIVPRLVGLGLDEGAAKQIAETVESQRRWLTRDECYALYHAVGLEEMCDGEGK